MSGLKSILVVDISHAFWATALSNVTPDASPRDMVLKEIKALNKGYDRVLIAADRRERSFRTVFWPEYKANRAQRAEPLWAMLNETIDACAANGYFVFRAPEHAEHEGFYYEADDLIGTIVQWCKDRAIAVDILSGDSDIASLVDDGHRIRMLRRYKGIHPLTESGVKDWIGVPPFMIPDLKALAGDVGDGYGNVFPGIGEATAIKMLNACAGSAVAAVELAISSEKKSAVGDTIKSLGMDRLKLGLKLSRLCIDVPIDLSVLFEKQSEAKLVAATPPADPARAEIVQAPKVHDAEIIDPDELATKAAPIDPPVKRSESIAKVDPTARMLIAPAEAKERLRTLRALINAILVPGVDYMKIPGCGDREVLTKSGAEKVSEVFGYAPTFQILERVERWDDDRPFFHYLVKCVLRRKEDGLKVAECIASCNSKESKYADRWAFERDIPPYLDKAKLRTKQVRNKKPKQGEGPTLTMFALPNERIYDQVNTLIKMAEKRAFVGALIIAARLSAMFTQDLEDMRPNDSHYGSPEDAPEWEQE